MSKTVLAFDTSAAHVAACLRVDGGLCGTATQDMKRGQAEHLFPMLADVLRAAGLDWSAIDRIGVGIGPGNFTGIRIAISAARGLAMSLDRPVIGVSTFEVIRHLSPGATAAVPAPRDMAYVLAPGSETPEMALLASLDAPALPPAPALWAETIARIAGETDAATAPLPAPMYLKPADAAPPRDAPPVIIA